MTKSIDKKVQIHHLTSINSVCHHLCFAGIQLVPTDIGVRVRYAPHSSTVHRIQRQINVPTRIHTDESLGSPVNLEPACLRTVGGSWSSQSKQTTWKLRETPEATVLTTATRFLV